VATYTLDIEDNFDFELIGISSHEKDYRLAWALNKRMGWRMIRKTDIELIGKKLMTVHAQFSYVHPQDQTVITLIDNKTPEGLFLPEVTQFDYVLKIESPREDCDDAFFRKIRSTPFVLTAYPIEIQKLKSKHNLLHEFR
jgi:hypothetical protein